MNPVRIDRAFMSRALLLWLLLLWPLLIFRGPAYFDDTLSYYKGGAVAVGIVGDRLEPAAARSPPPPPAGSSAQAGPGTAPASEKAQLLGQAKGVRSISYSLFAYLLAGPDHRFLPLAIVQALLAAFCITAAFAAASTRMPSRFAAAAVPLALATPLAPFVCYAMPDIFAGFTILLLALLMSPPRPLALPLMLALMAIAAFAITTHPSHILLAAVMVAVPLLFRLARGAIGRGRSDARLYRTAGVVAVAVLAVIATGVVGFGEASIAPRRYPFLLARSVEIPPARAYLQAACKTKPFEVCRLFPKGLPTNSYDFLWGEQGVDAVATPAQMKALREEEPGIILAMVRAAPIGIGGAVLGGIVRQLATFDLSNVHFNDDVRAISPIKIEFTHDRTPNRAAIRLSEGLTVASVLLSLLGFAFWLRRRNANFSLAAMLILGVVANAAVCSTLSTIASRYQARVVWVLPLAALLLWVGRRADHFEGTESRKAKGRSPAS